MSRFFSATAAVAKALQWKPCETTKPVGWVKRGVEEYFDVVMIHYPHLSEKVNKITTGEIRGDPHPSPHRRSLNDPLHGTGAVGRNEIKGKDRMTSLHVYPNGVVKPSSKVWPTVTVTPASPEELGEDAVWLDEAFCKAYASEGHNDATEDHNDATEDPDDAFKDQDDTSKEKDDNEKCLIWRAVRKILRM